jgi:predicted permease
MNHLRRFFGWSQRAERALAEEVEAHRALVEEELRRAGFSAADAAAESRRRLGNVTLAREDSREVWTLRWLDQLRQYLQYGARGLRREPLFALTAILSLALGTAATTTVFSVVDAEIWRPLPFPDPYRLVAVYSRGEPPRTEIDGISLEELAEWRRAPGLASVAASGWRRRRTLQLDHAESVLAADVTSNYFSTLGRTALRGRVFIDDDARGTTTAILTERGWTRTFDRSPDVLGRTMTLDGHAVTIVGIVADDDSLGPGPEWFLPIDEGSTAGLQPPARVFSMIGRLAAGATAGAVREQIQAVVTRRAAIDPDRRGHTAFVDDLSAFNTPLDHRALYFFLGASVVVLLLTVTNAAGLMLSRVLRRAPEFALRGALGGGPSAIAAQLVVEAALVVVPGGLLGLWLAFQAVGLVGQIVPDDFLHRGTHIVLDVRVVAFCGAVALATLAGLGLVPLGLARRTGASAMGSGSRTSATPAASRARTVLLTAQIALTVVLLAGAGMFLRSFVALLHAPLGFDPGSGWSARVTLGGPRYADDDRRRTYAEALVERARATPGVRIASVATTSPLMSGWLVMATDSRHPGVNGAGAVRAIYRAVSGDYFQTIGTPIMRGRAIAPSDRVGTPDVAVVNEQFARNLFPGEDAVGQSIDLTALHGATARNGRITIVGVASNIQEIGADEVAFADMYVPFAQRPASDFELLVRGGPDDASMSAALRSAAAAVDPTVPVTSVSSLASRVAGATQGGRFNLLLVAGFATVAVLIAAIGIYGAMAYAATARWREYGVRLALGATPRGLVGRALWQAARMGLMGGVAGITGAIVFAMLIGDGLYLVPGRHSGVLFQVTTTDPPSLVGAAVGAVLVALVAGAVPARRVSKIDPVKALRAE